jgi:phosphohistidine phosphatase
MHLFFLRHGIAEDRNTAANDFDRKLIPEGISEIERLAQGLKRLDLKLDRIYTSPLPRSDETARIVAGALEIGPENLIVEPELAPGQFDMDQLRALLKDERRQTRIMFVGHEPDLSLLVEQLVGGASIDLKKGGLARVEANRVEPGCGVLRWLLTPAHLG